LAVDLAGEQAVQARSQRLPQIAFRGIFEADRQQFVNKGGANWMIAASLRWNLFDGNRSKQMQNEALQQAAAARATEKQLQSAYSNGLANVTDILRADTALLDARTRRLAAIYDQRMAAIALEAAAGTLNGASDVLK